MSSIVKQLPKVKQQEEMKPSVRNQRFGLLTDVDDAAFGARMKSLLTPNRRLNIRDEQNMNAELLKMVSESDVLVGAFTNKDAAREVVMKFLGLKSKDERVFARKAYIETTAIDNTFAKSMQRLYTDDLNMPYLVLAPLSPGEHCANSKQTVAAGHLELFNVLKRRELSDVHYLGSTAEAACAFSSAASMLASAEALGVVAAVTLLRQHMNADTLKRFLLTTSRRHLFVDAFTGSTDELLGSPLVWRQRIEGTIGDLAKQQVPVASLALMLENLTRIPDGGSITDLVKDFNRDDDIDDSFGL